MQNGSRRQQNAYVSILGKIFNFYFVLQRYLNLWYVYLKIQILGIIKIQSQESCGIARKDMQVKKMEFCFWNTTHYIDKFPPHFPWCPCPKESLPDLLHCQLLGHSLQPVPQLGQLLDVLWFLMHFDADGFIRLTNLQQDTAKTIKKSLIANKQTGKPAMIHPLPILKVV